MRRTAIFLIPLLAAMVLAGATGPARAQVVALDVDYEHGDTALQGVLAYDDAAEGKLPGVLVVHEWYGLNEHSINTAKRLASLGYAAFAVDMYGAGVLAENNEQAAELAQPFYKDRQLMRGRAMAGYDALVGAGMVDKARVFAMGYCFGGSTVLELARSGAPLLGVASFHGGLGTPHPGDMQNFQGEVLALHGAEDPHVPAEDVAAFKDELRNAGVDWTFIAFGKAVHSFTNPAADSEGARYNERAATRGWSYMLEFYEALLDGM